MTRIGAKYTESEVEEKLKDQKKPRVGKVII